MIKVFKVSGILLSLFFTIMLFIMLLRLGSGKGAFISVRVLWDYISSIDLKSSWIELSDKFMELVASFQNIDVVSETANEFEKFFAVIQNLGIAIFTFLKFPIDILIAVCKFIYSVLDTIASFFVVVLQ